MKSPILASLILLTLPLCSVIGQTKIALPPAKVEFSEIGKKKSKKDQKKVRLSDKLKATRVDEVGKYLKKNTDLSKEDIQKYKQILSSFDSTEFEGFEEELRQLDKLERINYEKEKVKEYKTQSKKAKEEFRGLKNDSLSWDKPWEGREFNIDSTFTEPHLNLDSLTETAQDHEYIEKYSQESELFQTYKDSVSNVSLDSLSKNEQIKNKLEKLLDEKVRKQGLELYDGLSASDRVTSPVKQYIPDLEKFNYKKPEIPDEKLTKALVEKEKKKRIDELKSSIIPEKSQDTTQKVHFYDRLTIGGYFEYIPKPERIDLSPSIAYGFNKKLSFGVGYNLSIPLENTDNQSKIDGYRIFADYVFYQSIYLHIESEWLRQQSPLDEIPDHKERNTYLGLGKQFRYKFLQSNILVLYNFNAPSQLHTKQFTIRFGINYSP